LRAGVNRTAESDENSEPTAYNTAQYLLFQVPAITSYPLDFSNLGSIRLPLISAWSLPWTATTLCLNALDATDSYQPGIPVLLDDAKAEDAPPRMDRYSAGIFLRSAENSWHVGFATENTGSVFAGDNLPPLPGRGSVERPQEFRWFTRDTVELSGPLTRWADISATATGQWASQTAPLWPEAIPIDSRTLIGNARGSVRLSPRDRIDALYSGSRLDLSRGGWPSGIEAILASPIMPSFYGVDGFENLREVDLFDLVQAGWTREFGGSALELLADLLNLLNNGNKIVESDLSGLLFNQRPALAVPPPRTLRLGLRWHY
jgi:hypothetical protein